MYVHLCVCGGVGGGGGGEGISHSADLMHKPHL